MNIVRNVMRFILFIFLAYLALILLPMNWAMRRSSLVIRVIGGLLSVGLIVVPFVWLGVRSESTVTAELPTTPAPVVQIIATPMVGTPPVTASSERINGTISGVVNADTLDIVLADGNLVRIRLTGMDAPEPSLCYGPQAAQYVYDNFAGASVILEGDPTQPAKDKFGRVFRLVRLPNGETLNGHLIARGYAFEYTYFTPHTYQAEWRTLEDQAQAARLGVWSEEGCNGQSERPDREFQTITWVMPPDVVEAKVTRIRDGDTIEVEIGGVNEAVRFIGIDAPETGQCHADLATQQMRQWTEGQTVFLEADSSQDDRDAHNRLLRYVWTADSVLLNAAQIEQGHAHEYTFRVVYKYESQFMQLEHVAHINGLGLWNPNTCDGGSRRFSRAYDGN